MIGPDQNTNWINGFDLSGYHTPKKWMEYNRITHTTKDKFIKTDKLCQYGQIKGWFLAHF